MFSGKEDPRVTASGNMEDLFMNIFERKRRIVEQVKHHVDLFDKHLVSKCRLEGVSPPSWLSSPPQTFEFNKEKIISELLCPQSRPCPSTRPFSYQQPVSVVGQDLSSLLNNPLEEQLLEEEQQHHLSHNSIRHISNHSHEQYASIASPRDVHEEEGLPENVSTGFRENQSCPSPKYSQNQIVGNSPDATSSGCSQGKLVAESVSTTGCEQKPSSPGDCQDETEPNTCLDPGLSVAKIQRSKSRQKALERRSSAKASGSRSNSRYEFKPSPSGNIGLGIASLRSDCVSEIKLFKHDENDKDCRGSVENSSSQGKEEDKCIKSSSTTEPSTTYQEVPSEQKSLTGDTYASNEAESPHKSGHVNETDMLQFSETIDEVSAKVDEQVDDPQSRLCSETAYRDGGTSSKSLSHDIIHSIETIGEVSAKVDDPQSRICSETAFGDRGTSSKSLSQDILQSIETIDEVIAKVDEQVDGPQSRIWNETADLNGCTRFKSLSPDSSKREHQKSNNSFSRDFLSRSSNPLLWEGHEVKLPQVMPVTNEISVVTDVGTSISQYEINARSRSTSRENRSKTEDSGFVECSSVDAEPRHSISLLHSGDVKESLIPSTIDVEDLVVETITSDNQSKEKGECGDTNRCSSPRRVSQTGISTYETTTAEAIQDSLSKTKLFDFVESSPVALQLRHSVLQSDEDNVFLKPVTVTNEALLVEKDSNGKPVEISTISKSRSSNQTDITVAEPVVVESSLQESGTPENLVDHSKRYGISCGYMEVQPQSSLTKKGSHLCHGIISWPRSSAIEEESANEYKALSAGSDNKSDDKQLEVRAGDSSSRTHDLPDFVKPESPCFGDYEERNFDEVPMNSRDISTMEKVPTPESAARVLDVPSLTDSEVNLYSGRNDTEDHNSLKGEMVLETESPASQTFLKVEENQPPESNAVTGHMDSLTKGPQHETFSNKGVPPVNRNIACTQTGESHGPKSSIQEFFCSGSSVVGSQLQNKRRKIREKPASRVPSSSPGGDILDPDSVRETVHHMEEAACHNLDHYDVELQKMIGSASSAELRFEENYLFKEAGLISPASLSFIPEQLTVQRSHIAPKQGFELENMDFLPFAGETSHPLASVVRDSDCSPCLSPLHLIGSGDGNLPVLEGFIIQSDDENQSGSKSQIKQDSFQLPRTAAESATMIEQICKSACRATPSLHRAKTFKFDMDLDQSVSTELLDGMFFSQNLEGGSVFDNLGINHDSTGRSYAESLSFSGAASFADARNPRTSPTEKLWYRNSQKSSSSEKRGSQTPDLPCISEENETVDEEAENLCANTPHPMSSEKRGSSVLDLPCIAEENEISEAVNEASDSEREKVSAERKPLDDVNEDPMEVLPSVFKAKVFLDRQSLDSVSTAISFSAKCNNSVKSKAGRQNGGSRRFTGKGKENQGGAGAGKNAKPPSSRFSKAKLSCSSSLTGLRPRLPEKETRHNNIVSNITSFIPLVQQQKPAAALITGKRDVKVKALEAAEASKRIAEQKENDRKMKKEAMKLERARQEQENMRKQEVEKKKKEDDRKKKEAEMTLKQEMEKKKKEEDRKKKEAELIWKQEMEKKKKEEERKRKEFEMAERKRQREEEDKKLKEAKRQRIVETQRQQREADQKIQAEKELKRQAMDARIKAQKELKEEQINAEKTREQANTRIPEVRSKSLSNNDTNVSRSSRDDDFKVISNSGKMSEESYDISPYKCSDDEGEEEDDDDNFSNNKYVPTWASKSNVLRGVMSQQTRDPDMNFPAKSFCPISQIVLPRKLRLLNSDTQRH